MNKISSLKIFGERNSGTNYIQKLINSNYDITIMQNCSGPDQREQRFRSTLNNLQAALYTERIFDQRHFSEITVNLGWKHSCINLENFSKFYPDVGLVCVVRHPASWVKSMYRNPFHFHRKVHSLEEFISTPWITSTREYTSKIALDSPLDLWNEKVKSYLDAQRERPESVLILRYEDIVSDFYSLFSKLEDSFGLLPYSRKNIINNARPFTKDTKEFDKYKGELVKCLEDADYSPECKNMIREKISKDIFNEIYKKL